MFMVHAVRGENKAIKIASIICSIYYFQDIIWSLKSRKCDFWTPDIQIPSSEWCKFHNDSLLKSGFYKQPWETFEIYTICVLTISGLTFYITVCNIELESPADFSSLKKSWKIAVLLVLHKLRWFIYYVR